MSEKVPKAELAIRLKKIPEWEINKERLVRSFEFDEFMEGIDFVNGVAEIAEEADHHPDIIVRYTTVKLSLITHDCGAISESDFKLAARIDTLVD